MKYFKKDLIIKADAGDNEARIELEGGIEEYKIEFTKTCKKLPNEFVRIYKDHNGFHDASFPQIRFLTEYPGFTYNPSEHYPTRVQFVLANCDDIEKAWEIQLDFLKAAKIDISMDTQGYAVSIEDYVYDEILIYDKENLSWEILLRIGEMLFIFKKLRIRELSEVEIEYYRKPILNDNKEKY